MKTQLLEARNKLYEALPTGNVNSFELIEAINIHLKKLDNIIDTLEGKYVLSNVMHCSCDYGIIVCPGCNGKKESVLGKCAGCNGSGVRICGKCGGLNNA